MFLANFFLQLRDDSSMEAQANEMLAPGGKHPNMDFAIRFQVEFQRLRKKNALSRGTSRLIDCRNSFLLEFEQIEIQIQELSIYSGFI
jgi:hypothetical protein